MQDEVSGEDATRGVLDKDDIDVIATIFDRVLRNTRHTGVIDKCSEGGCHIRSAHICTHFLVSHKPISCSDLVLLPSLCVTWIALKLIASRMVRSSSPVLRSLPEIWLESTLADVIKGDLYVLRRSAGVPHYILAILGLV